MLALEGDGEGEIFNRQAKEFFEAVGSARKQLVNFRSADGGGAHCQVDNDRVLQEVTYDWLDEVFGAAPWSSRRTACHPPAMRLRRQAS